MGVPNRPGAPSQLAPKKIVPSKNPATVTTASSVEATLKEHYTELTATVTVAATSTATSSTSGDEVQAPVAVAKEVVKDTAMKEDNVKPARPNKNPEPGQKTARVSARESKTCESTASKEATLETKASDDQQVETPKRKRGRPPKKIESPQVPAVEESSPRKSARSRRQSSKYEEFS